MAKRRKASRAGEASVPPTPSASEREMLDASVARLSGLNVDQLRLHWRNHVGGVAPAHLRDGCSCACSLTGSRPWHSGISIGRSCGVCASPRGEALEYGGCSSLCDPRPDDARGRRAQARSSAGAGWLHAIGPGHDPTTTGMPGTAASTTAFLRSPRRSQARTGTDTASSG